MLAPENITPDLTKKMVERKCICWNFGTLAAFIFFGIRWSSVTTTPPCSTEFCSSKNSKWTILSQQQHALTPAAASEFFNVEHWESCRLYQCNEPSEEKLCCSPATTSNTGSAHFWSDTTALLRDTIALPKWKQQLLSLPFVLSSCLCFFYCQVFSHSPFEITKFNNLWRDRKACASYLPLLETQFALVDISALGFSSMLSMVLLLQVTFLFLARDV